MPFPTKSVRIGKKKFVLAGVSADDPYFASVGDDCEPEFRILCDTLIEPDYVCLDIGANIGIKTLLLSQYVPRGKVIAVEAAPTVGDLLALNTKGLSNVTLCRCAITDQDGEVGFSEQSAYGHVAIDGEKVLAKRLSSIVQENGLRRLDFVKIDIEGLEYRVLKDALPLFDAYRSLVLFEFNSWCQAAFGNTNLLEFANWIFKSFTNIYMIRPSRIWPLRRAPDDPLAFLHMNMIEHRCVTDLVVTNAPERLGAAETFLRQAPPTILAERFATLKAFSKDPRRALETVIRRASGKQ